jgi:competence protein ComEA
MKILSVLLVSASLMFAVVNMNSASEKDFASLKGVGVKKAQEIVKFRTKVKCFKTIDQLSKVKGIGKKTVEKNRKNLVLGKCKR